MAQKTAKYHPSKYKYVRYIEVNDKGYWGINYPGVCKKSYPNEREAALALDKYLISKGKDPINILKKREKNSI